MDKNFGYYVNKSIHISCPKPGLYDSLITLHVAIPMPTCL